MMKRFTQVFGAQARGLQLFGCGLLVLACVALAAGGYEAFQQYQERQALEAIVKTFHTGDPYHDIRAAVSYVYQHAYLGDGKYGILRASATQVLDPSIGGQCGDFVRLTVNLLNVMGYNAHRIYIFPVAAPGHVFDPIEQQSYHVVAEVWVDNHWVAVDPLHGLVFQDETGKLATLKQVANDPFVIQDGYRQQPQERHMATYGALISGPYFITSETFSNPQTFNWGQRPFSWFYKAAQRFGPIDLSTIYLPVLAEQPYAMQAILGFAFFGLFAVAGATCFSLAARASARHSLNAPLVKTPSPNLQAV